MGAIAWPRATDRNLRVLAAIVDLHAEHGFMPTVREIGRRVGLSSTSAVHRHLLKLERLGLVEAHPERKRWRVTDLGRTVRETVQ